MNWQDENLSDELKDKIRNYVWSNLSSRRIAAQTFGLYTANIFSVIIAMLGGNNDNDEQGIIK